MARVIFLGPPGAGKGTQAALLSQNCHIPHISTGEILRSSVENETDLGLKAKSYMDRGELVPDQLMLDLVEERLHEKDTLRGWILDGFPRTVPQAIFLEEMLAGMHHQTYNCAINLSVPDEILMERLLVRGRKDDNEEVIRHRLDIYHDQTIPLFDFYRDREKLVIVDGNQPIEAVTEELHRIVQSYLLPEKFW